MPETIAIHSLHGSTINHDSLPAIGEELRTDGLHPAKYGMRFQFECETTVTHSIEGASKGKLNDIGIHPWTSESDEI